MLDFLIVGALKRGTTCLYNNLDQHPQIFLPAQKELNFFADELFPGYLNEADYRKQFQAAAPELTICGASAWHPTSRTAARTIRKFDLQARIIMLREPVETRHSLPGRHHFQGLDDLDMHPFSKAPAPAPPPETGSC